MRHTNDLGRDKIFPLVCRLAIPTMLAQMVSVLYSIVDRIYIGNIAGIGDLALAGVGVCGPIVTLLSSFASLVGLGGAPILAMRLGEGRPREAEKVVSNGFLTLLILSAVLTSVFLLLKDRLLMVFGASEATFGYADTYLTIYTCGDYSDSSDAQSRLYFFLKQVNPVSTLYGGGTADAAATPAADAAEATATPAA